jgi:hypothetical protein
MMPPSDPLIRSWWPSTQSIDLVEAPVEVTARAVHQEYVGFANDDAVRLDWHQVPSLKFAFELVTTFYNIPTIAMVLPTKSSWSALWYNTFLCDGYDSLCNCLCKNHSLRTIHWKASDVWTTTQSGAMLCHRAPSPNGPVERYVQAAQSDSRWDFFAHGEPLPVEDTEGYTAQRKRDRFNETRLMSLLKRLGADPWHETFYDLPGRVAVISRPAPIACIARLPVDVIRP